MSLKLVNIHKDFGTPPTHVLKDVSLEIQDGDFISLIGRSGSGKSTLLYIMSSLDEPSTGSVFINGKNVFQLSSKDLHRFRNENIGFVFQFHYLIRELSALENVLMPAMKTQQEKKKRDFAVSLLEEFGLGDKLSRLPTQLSGGEQQRVAIARALVMSPQFIFADEPTGNLDSTNGEIVMSLLERINREKKTTIVYVTHDMDYAARAKRSFKMVDGRLAD